MASAPRRSGGTSRRSCTSSRGFDGDAFFHGLPYPDRPHFSAFSFEACDAVYRDPDVFAFVTGTGRPRDRCTGALNSMLSMGGAQHRRYRTLVQPSFVPAKAQWWIAQLDRRDGAPPHRRLRRPTAGPSSTSTSAPRSPCSRSPAASACPSSRRSTSGRAVPEPRRRRRDDPARSSTPGAREPRGRPHQRARRGRDDRRRRHDAPADRRRDPLVRAAAAHRRLGDDVEADGHHARRACSQRPDVLEEVKQDRELVKAAVEESVRWNATDPMFSRWVHARHRVVRRRDPEGIGDAPLPRRREPRPGPVGTA